MLALLLLSTLASLIASSVLGFRLLRLALRTRQIPELAIGASFVLAGVVGYVLMLAGNPASGAVTLEQAHQLFVAGYTIIGIGVCAVYVFIWRTFRPQAIWAGGLALLGIAAILATNHISIDPAGGAQGPGYWVGLVARLGAGAWGAVESLRWWSLMQRRLALGLADPVVANRFLLWGLANGTTFLIFVGTAFIPQQVGEAAAVISSGQMMMISSLTMATAVFQWFAFFPSHRYLGWVRRRAEASAS